MGALSFFRLKNGLFGEKKENHVPCSKALVPTEVEPPMRPWTWQGGRGSRGQENVHSERGASDGHSLPHPPVAALLGLPPTRFLTPRPDEFPALCGKLSDLRCPDSGHFICEMEPSHITGIPYGLMAPSMVLPWCDASGRLLLLALRWVMISPSAPWLPACLMGCVDSGPLGSLPSPLCLTRSCHSQSFYPECFALPEVFPVPDTQVCAVECKLPRTLGACSLLYAWPRAYSRCK